MSDHIFRFAFRVLKVPALAAAVALAILSVPALADTIKITGAEAELEDGATTADVFMDINNSGKVPDRLYAVKTPVASQVFFSSLGENEERQAEGKGEDIPRAIAYEVKPSEVFRLHHDGPHITLRGLTRPLSVGDAFSLTLYFEQAGPVTVEIEIEGHH